MIFTISILTFNRKNVLFELLNSLKQLQRDDVEIIVIDNFSNDGTAEMVKDSFSNVKLIILHRNFGAEGRNVGIINAKGSIVITVDDDIIGLNKKSLADLKKIFDKKPNVATACFKVLDYYDGKVCNWCHPYPEEEFSNKEFITTEITEGAVAFRKSVLMETGLYSHHFFLSHEGADLCARIMNKGYEIIYSPEISVRHKYSMGGRKSWRRYYYDTKNNFLLVFRNYRILYGTKYLFNKTFVMMLYSIRDGFFFYWLKAILNFLFHLPEIFNERNPISKETEKKMKEINSNRPSVMYYFKKRLKQKQVRI